MRKLKILNLIIVFLIYTVSGWTLPVTEGGLTQGVEVSMPDENTLNIIAPHKAVINYSSFDIAQNEKVQFFQPSASSIVLNRINCASPSQIAGSLISNGRVFLLNPNGVIFTGTSSINMGSLLVAAANISDADFLSGNYKFDLNMVSPGAKIINQGTIQTVSGGFIGLFAPEVKNTGTIYAHKGTIAIGASEKVTVDFDGDGLVNFTLEGNIEKSSIENQGTIQAHGGEILLSSNGMSEVVDSVVNNTGTIEAVSLEEQGGIIRLVSTKGSIVNNGEIKTDSGTIEIQSGSEIHNSGSIEAEEGVVIFDADGAVTSKGVLRAETLNETGASFLVGGTMEVGTASMDNDDLAVNYDTGDYSGAYTDAENIIINASAVITLTGDTIFTADNDTDGTGAFTMNSGSSIVGGNNDLEIKASETSTLLSITGVDELKISESQDDSWPTYNANGNITCTDFILNEETTFITDIANTFTASNSFSILTDGNVLSAVFKRFAGGDGLSADTAYQIVDIYGLQAMNSDLDAFYILNNLIDASVTSTWNSNAGFMPVGGSSGANPDIFTGAFNGNSKVITELTINRPAQGYIGLFGKVSSSFACSNVYLEDVDMTGAAFIGGLVGGGNGIVDNCYSTGDISQVSSRYGGGLIGYIDGMTITNSYTTADVDGGVDRVTGGFAGTSTNCTITNCYASGNVTSGNNGFLGGFIGAIGASSVLTGCYAQGNVNTPGDYAGGFVGNISSSLTTSITNCYAIGNVTGDDSIGGFAGESNNGVTISNSYCTGLVNGDAKIGGFVGDNNDAGACTYANNYWNTDTAGQASDVGEGASVAEGKITEQMKQQGTYSTWDFSGETVNGTDDIWGIAEGCIYPFLEWKSDAVCGTVYSGSGTNSADSKTVKLAVNGTATGDSAVSDANGIYYFLVDDSVISADANVLTYIDGDTLNGNTVAISDGGSIYSNDIYGNNTLIIKSETSNPVTNAILDNAHITDAGDILYSVSDNDLTAVNLFVWQGDIYTQGGAVDLSGNLVIQSNSTLNAEANSINIAGNFTNVSDGAFISTGTITFDGGGTSLLTAMGVDADHDFETIVVSGGTILETQNALKTANLTTNSISDIVDITGNDLEVTGTLNNSGTIKLNGDETVDFTSDSTKGIIEYLGSENYTSLNAGFSYYDLKFSGTGTWESNTAVTLNNNLTINSNASFDINGNNLTVSGAFNNEGILKLQGSENLLLSMDTDSGTIEYNAVRNSFKGLILGKTYYNLKVNAPGSFYAISGKNVKVNNQLNIVDGQLIFMSEEKIVNVLPKSIKKNKASFTTADLSCINIDDLIIPEIASICKILYAD